MEDAIQFGSQWYIPAVSPRADDRARVLKGGEIQPSPYSTGTARSAVSGSGRRDSIPSAPRHLSQWELAVAGRSPLLLNSTVKLDNSVLLVDQIIPDLYIEGQLRLAKGNVHLRRSSAVHDCAFYERLEVANYHGKPITIEIEYRFAADFHDIFEVRGVKRSRRGVMLEPRRDADHAVVLGYWGIGWCGVPDSAELRGTAVGVDAVGGALHARIVTPDAGGDRGADRLCQRRSLFLSRYSLLRAAGTRSGDGRRSGTAYRDHHRQ